MGTAAKTKVNPHFGSKYADLASIMDAVREPLAANGLAVSQSVANDANGVSVTTTLLHESGETLVSEPCWLPVGKKDPQGYGSAITYARRYSLASLLGIVADEDDDGNAASGAGKLPPPAGVAGVKAKLPKPSPPAEVRATKGGREHPDMQMGNFGRGANKHLSELSDDDVSFYRNACKRTLADSSKERFHANETQRLAIFDQELRFRGLPVDQ
jgi:hypothetical protein